MEALSDSAVHYPDSDGKRMADNTLQFEWIAMLKGNLDALLSDDFVAGDLLWYPVKGNPKERVAPDVMVALGRPKGYRGSYKQWEEDDIPPQVVFEVLSPGNTLVEMARKGVFYRGYGVREFYLLDPERHTVSVWAEADLATWAFEPVDDYTSPLLGVRFTRVDGELAVFGPDGERFLTFAELAGAHRLASEGQHEAEAARREAEAGRREAEAARREAEARAAALAETLRALGIDPDAL